MSATTSPGRRLDGSMSLLLDTMNHPLDTGYADRAARRAAGQHPEPTGLGRTWRTAVTAGLLLALGLVTGTAVAQVRERAQLGSGLRDELAAEVRERTAASDALAARAADLRDTVVAEQEAALGADTAGRSTAERLERLGVLTGTLAVVGPGVRVLLDDAPEGAAPAEDPLRGGTPVDGRVQDRDLQDLVNGLWAAGAEAVAVNGQRLTALTAIRSAGDAVLVDFRPLSPPYVVDAVGDPGDLEVGLVDGPAGRRLATYASLYGIRFELGRAEELRLPGAGAPELRSATGTTP